MFTHRHTILLITRQVLARIDLTGKRRLSVKQIWTQPSCDYDSIQSEVLRTLKLGTRRPTHVTVVSPEFWTDVLSVPADVATIAKENEINQALALEAEVESGLSAFDSRTIAFKIHDLDERNEDGQWCVTQVANAQLRELSHTLRMAGTRLHGIAHPLVAQLAAAKSLSVEGVQELLRPWREKTEFTEVAMATLATLATDWAACLTLRPKFPMLMMAQAEALSNAQPIALSASLALLAAGGCGWWHWQSEQCLAATTQAIERLEKQHSQQEATEAVLKNAEASVVQLRQEVVKAQSVRQTVERQLQLAGATHSLHNRRWSALIDALAASAAANCWVKKIESHSVQTVVHGLALDQAAANGFAGRLELALNGSGWRTAPATTAVSPHNLVAFQIVLKAKLKPDEPVANPEISSCTPAQIAIVASTDLARGKEP